MSIAHWVFVGAVAFCGAAVAASDTSAASSASAHHGVAVKKKARVVHVYHGDRKPHRTGARAASKTSHRKLASRSAAQHGAAAGAEPTLRSSVVMVVNQRTGETLYEKNPATPSPIASVTKLMTAMVTLDSGVSLAEPIEITDADVDRLRNSSSRLRTGTVLSRRELLRLALMSSENRAAAALARTYPGGTPRFVAAMNRKARALGMDDTRFCDSTGLRVNNVSTARDLVKMVRAAYHYDLIREATTTWSHEVMAGSSSRILHYRNTNRLINNEDWEIGLSKTGYINESGRCLVMQAILADRPLIIVLLDAPGKLTPIGDANRIRKWLERAHAG